MKNMYLMIFPLVFLSLCSSGVTGNTVSDKELEVLRILYPLLENNGEDIGDTKGGTTDVYDGDTDADTDGEMEDTEGTDGDTGDADEDTEGTDKDIGDADGDTEGTDKDIGDADGDTGDADEDTEGTDKDIGDADEDTEGTAEDTGDADGDTGDADGDTGDADGDTGDADGDTGDAGGDTGDAEDFENLVRTSNEMKRGRSAGTDELSFQSRRQNSDPCSNYTTLSDAWRNVQDVNDGSAGRCDRTFAGEWYRFTGSAGNAMLTVAPPGVNRCGTDAPMWMKGQHPTLADGEVSRQACAYWQGNTCNWQTTIQVRACSAGYYVYKLPAPPACRLTYCGSSNIHFVDLDGNDCAGNPCVNGDCVDGRNSYTCNCNAGYEGSNCERNIDDCAANPCVNGDCVDGINTYTCTCNSGYEGDTCERDVDGCSPDPCDPLATCQDVAAPGTGATCTCPVGYEGDGESGGSGCKVAVPPALQELSGSTSCTNDYMELSIPEDQLTDIDLNNLHWRPDRNCGATTNGTHYLFRTELYDCGTEVTFGAKYVTFLNTINILGTHLNSGVITREGDIWITSKYVYS
ncbi:uncharacterized protein LOC144907615 [Branchiostoma floridae x Branchiostoma belcheri]